MSYQGGTHIYILVLNIFFNAFYFKIQVILRGELRGEHSAQLVCQRLAIFKFILFQNSYHTRGEHIYILVLKTKFNAFYFKIQVILRGEHSARLVCHRLALFKFILFQNSC